MINTNKTNSKDGIYSIRKKEFKQFFDWIKCRLTLENTAVIDLSIFDQKEVKLLHKSRVKIKNGKAVELIIKSKCNEKK